MTEDSKPPRPRFETWGQRIAWLGRMPIKYRFLFATQFLILSLSMRFRVKELERAQLRQDAEKKLEESNESNPVVS